MKLPELDLIKRRFTGEGLIPASMAGVSLEGGSIAVDATVKTEAAGGISADCNVNGDISLKTPGGPVHEQVNTELWRKWTWQRAGIG